jgi:hypothetical protein
MKNGYIHNHIVRITEQQFRKAGAIVRREYPVEVRGRCGIIDLRVDFPSWPIACEVETTSRRVAWDIDKARAAGAKILLILTPSGPIATSCDKQMHLKEVQGGMGLVWGNILTLGALPEWLAKYLPLISPSFEESKTNTFGKQIGIPPQASN